MKFISALMLSTLVASTAFAELRPKQIFRSRETHLRDEAGRSGKSTGGSNNGIFYNGGPVMLGTTNVYYIWYGNWAGNTATSILEGFASNLGGSAYYNINTTYTDSANRRVANSVAFKQSVINNYSHGKSLSDANIRDIVMMAINGTNVLQSGNLPFDVNGVYFVLTSADVTASSGFCTQYCGWHNYNTTAQGAIKYSFVGNPERCPSSCSAQTVSPNGNVGADGMASIIAHELEESVTDPVFNGWYDRRGYENADKCAWTFGTTATMQSGAKYNMLLNGTPYLIQRNWVNASGGYCAISY